MDLQRMILMTSVEPFLQGTLYAQLCGMATVEALRAVVSSTKSLQTLLVGVVLSLSPNVKYGSQVAAMFVAYFARHTREIMIAQSLGLPAALRVVVTRHPFHHVFIFF